MALRQRLADWLEGVWYRQEPPPAPLCWLEWLYRRLGDPGPRPRETPPVPVIVVGNLTAGGSGKTPVVQALVRHLQHTGKSVGVISRGYGGDEPATPLRVDAATDPRRGGDEAVMLAAATGVGVWVCRHREAALEAACAAGCRVVVSDDGLQHRKLPRSLEICVIDGVRRYGNGHLLPAGPLRQAPARLQAVDWRLVRLAAGSEGPLQPGEAGFTVQATGVRHLGERQRQPPTVLAPGPVDAFAGIGRPEAMFETLEAAGIRVRRHPRRDHQHYRPGALDALAGPVVVSAKDAVKLKSCTDRTDVWVLEVEAVVPDALLAAVDRHLEEFTGE